MMSTSTRAPRNHGITELWSRCSTEPLIPSNSLTCLVCVNCNKCPSACDVDKLWFILALDINSTQCTSCSKSPALGPASATNTRIASCTDEQTARRQIDHTVSESWELLRPRTGTAASQSLVDNTKRLFQLNLNRRRTHRTLLVVLVTD